MVQRGSNNAQVLAHVCLADTVLFLAASWLAAGLLLDAGSALPKGGQVMFRPQPLHQLPKPPSHVLAEGASCLEPALLKF